MTLLVVQACGRMHEYNLTRTSGIFTLDAQTGEQKFAISLKQPDTILLSCSKECNPWATFRRVSNLLSRVAVA